MKLSANSLGIFIFTAIATTAFVWMAKRPAVEGDAIKFGFPSAAPSTEKMSKEKPEILESTEKNVTEDSSDNTNNNNEVTTEAVNQVTTTEEINQASPDKETPDTKKAAPDEPDTPKE